MSTAIEGLKPELVWKYFAEISRIPRCSKNEAAMTKYILDTAKKLGLQAKADRFGNVVVREAGIRRPPANPFDCTPGASRHGVREKQRQSA